MFISWKKKMFMCTYIKLCLKYLLKNNLNFLHNGNPFKIFENVYEKLKKFICKVRKIDNNIKFSDMKNKKSLSRHISSLN